MSRLVILTLCLAACFFYMPILVLGIFSFNDASTMAFPLSGFTLSWYADLFGNQAFLGGFVTSFLIAQPVGLLGALMGLMAALAVTSPPWWRHCLRKPGTWWSIRSQAPAIRCIGSCGTSLGHAGSHSSSIRKSMNSPDEISLVWTGQLS